MSNNSNLDKFKTELESLILEGDLLHMSLLVDYGQFDLDELKEEAGKDIVLPSFKDNYERWYSLAMQVIRQILPDRLADFVRQYKDEKRRAIDALTYGISDYMVGLSIRRGIDIVGESAAISKFNLQLSILKSAQQRLESSLFSMLEVLQADLFDDELDVASELLKKGFFRAAGAVAGVVLERHLGQVCGRHNLKIRKNRPTINDFNQKLKDNGVVETPQWRFVQHLGDLRNLCDHNGDHEPTKEEVGDLVLGVRKITKTLF